MAEKEDEVISVESQETSTEEVKKEDVPVNGPPKTTEQRKIDKAAEPDKEEEKSSTEEESENETSQEADKDKEAELDTSVWGDAGDDVANSVLQTLQNSGVSPTDAKALLWDAVEAGDPSKVDQSALVEAVGKTQATLIMAGITNVTDRQNQDLAAVKSILSEESGGEDNWTKASKWARENLPQDELEELKTMLNKPGPKARFAAKDIITRYNKDPKNTALSAGNSQVKPDSKSDRSEKGISRYEYAVQLDKLRRVHRNNIPLDQYEKLKNQRRIGKKNGI